MGVTLVNDKIRQSKLFNAIMVKVIFQKIATPKCPKRSTGPTTQFLLFVTLSILKVDT
jgi:hypothetical protein